MFAKIATQSSSWKSIFRSSCTFSFTVSAQNVLKIFHNLSMIMEASTMLIRLRPHHCLLLPLYKLLSTKIMLNHVVFAKMMVGVCCPSLIFFYDVTSTTLYISCIFRWWWYNSCPVLVTFHAFYSFHWIQLCN